MAKVVDEKQNLQRSNPGKEKTGQKKIKKTAKNVGPVTKDKKHRKRRRKPKNQKIEQKKNVLSKVSGFISKYIPEYLKKYFSRNKGDKKKNGRGKKTRGGIGQKAGVVVSFVAILILVFVGSSVGFSKCEPGFRNVRKLKIVIFFAALFLVTV